MYTSTVFNRIKLLHNCGLTDAHWSLHFQLIWISRFRTFIRLFYKIMEQTILNRLADPSNQVTLQTPLKILSHIHLDQTILDTEVQQKGNKEDSPQGWTSLLTWPTAQINVNNVLCLCLKVAVLLSRLLSQESYQSPPEACHFWGVGDKQRWRAHHHHPVWTSSSPLHLLHPSSK